MKITAGKKIPNDSGVWQLASLDFMLERRDVKVGSSGETKLQERVHGIAEIVVEYSDLSNIEETGSITSGFIEDTTVGSRVKGSSIGIALAPEMDGDAAPDISLPTMQELDTTISGSGQYAGFLDKDVNWILTADRLQPHMLKTNIWRRTQRWECWTPSGSNGWRDAQDDA